MAISTDLRFPSVAETVGPSKVTVYEQRVFLIKFGEPFQKICHAAVRGDYDHDFFRIDNKIERRLCDNLMNKHFEFAEDLRKNGSYWNIVDTVDGNVRNRTRNDAIRDARKLLERSRGREFRLILGELFQEYSQPWGKIARKHIRNVWEATNRFMELVLEYLVDGITRRKIQELWLDPIMIGKLDAAYHTLEELLLVHKDQPFTTNHSFLESRRKVQQSHSMEELERRIRTEFTQPNQRLTLSDITRIMSDIDAANFVAAEDAFDNMNAYYEVALSQFSDNVPKMAIQAKIVRNLDEIFCSGAVYNMDAALVTQLAEGGMSELEAKISKLIFVTAESSALPEDTKEATDSADHKETNETKKIREIIETKKELDTKGSRNSNGYLLSTNDPVPLSQSNGNLASASSIPKPLSPSPGTKPSAAKVGHFSDAKSTIQTSVIAGSIIRPQAGSNGFSFGSTVLSQDIRPAQGAVAPNMLFAHDVSLATSNTTASNTTPESLFSRTSTPPSNPALQTSFFGSPTSNPRTAPKPPKFSFGSPPASTSNKALQASFLGSPASNPNTAPNSPKFSFGSALASTANNAPKSPKSPLSNKIASTPDTASSFRTSTTTSLEVSFGRSPDVSVQTSKESTAPSKSPVPFILPTALPARNLFGPNGILGSQGLGAGSSGLSSLHGQEAQAPNVIKAGGNH